MQESKSQKNEGLLPQEVNKGYHYPTVNILDIICK